MSGFLEFLSLFNSDIQDSIKFQEDDVKGTFFEIMVDRVVEKIFSDFYRKKSLLSNLLHDVRTSLEKTK